MIPKFNEFYIPVLSVLSDVEERDIKEITLLAADYVGLTKEDKNISTRSGNNLRYLHLTVILSLLIL